MTVEELDLARADDALATLLDRSGIQNALEEIKYQDKETWDELRATIGRAIRLSDEARGLRVVPVEATDRMVRAITWELTVETSLMDIWSAMLAASPFAPEEKEKG